jgi:hypothetical protein
MVCACVCGILARRREGPAFPDRAVGIAVAKQDVARVGDLDQTLLFSLRENAIAKEPGSS